MKLERYAQAAHFLRDTQDILMQREAQNNLILSNAQRGEPDTPADWLMLAVKDDAGSVLLCAIGTLPHNVVMYAPSERISEAACALAAREIYATGSAAQGLLGERALVACTAAELTRISGLSTRVKHTSNIMRLDAVRDFGGAPGHMRELSPEDMSFAPFWAMAFAQDCQLRPGSLEYEAARLQARLGKSMHYIWVDGHPVSQAARGRTTPHGAVINAVYTPPYLRGKGYASSCVARVSQLSLDVGFEFCVLFADAANPISNHIYAKMGYEYICVYDEIAIDWPQQS